MFNHNSYNVEAQNIEKKVMKGLKIIPAVVALAFAGAANASTTSIINLITEKGGVHNISYEQLAAQGVDLAGVPASKLAISSNGRSIARYVSDAQADGFNAGDSIEFVAGENYTIYSDKTVYSLHIDSDLAVDIPVVSSTEVSADGLATTGEAFYKKADKRYSWSSLNPNLKDPFLMDFISAVSPKNKDYAIDLNTPDVNGADALVSVVVSSAYSDIHEVAVKINETDVKSVEFEGIKRRTITAKVPAAALKASDNVVNISLPMTHDASANLIAIESIAVKYSKILESNGEALSYKAQSGLNVVSGVDANKVAVYQVNRKGVTRIDVTAQNNAVAFNNELGKGISTYVVPAGKALTPSLANVLIEDEALSTGEAEYLLISHADFIGDKLQELVNLRNGDYSTKVVDVAQIYAQYGKGVPDSKPIKNYIKHAVANMGTKMVVFVGGDTSDYHNYKSQSVSHIPTIYAPIRAGSQTINHAATDAAYGDIDFDGVPDIPVGRLPVRTLEELDIVISKIRSYEQRSYNDIILAIDKIDAGQNYDFDKQANKAIASLPEDVKARFTLTSLQNDGVEASKAKLISSINEGVAVTSWYGHSNDGQWGQTFFKTKDVLELTNVDKPTVMTQFGCWNTYFTDPKGNTMSHVAMLNSKNGAATVLGSSALSLASSEAALAKVFYAEAFKEGTTIGDALIKAKKELGKSSKAMDVLYGWQIIGDPALVIAN